MSIVCNYPLGDGRQCANHALDGHVYCVTHRMEAGRCTKCQSTIDRLRAAGYIYSAMARNSGPWEAVFMGPHTGRGSGPTLHEAIVVAAQCTDGDPE